MHTLVPVFEDLLAGWDGEEIVTRYDGPTETWMFVGVHSTVLGPAMGGTRMKAYSAPGDGLGDVLRLSQAMTFKQAAAHLPYGGGKAVLAVPNVPPPGSSARREILLRYAALVVQYARELGGGALEDELIRRLQAAPTNVPMFPDGGEVYRRLVRPAATASSRHR